MKKYLLAVGIVLSQVAVVMAGRYFAVITAVNADKGTITYALTFGQDKGQVFKGVLAKECVIKEGYYRLGKPATTKEGEDLANGLRNPIFKNASPEKPVRVNIYTADENDANVKAGEVIKILVNPPFKKKP